MTWWMLFLGALLVAVATYDATTTTISVSTRAGPLTTLVNRLVAAVIHRSPREGRRLALRTAGPASVVLAIGAWIVTLWAGWALVFSADADAVVSSTSRTPADATARWLFAAYTTYTLGYGNYLPTGAWEIVAAVALVVGFALFTLSVTYVIPVVSAVTARRSQASLVATAGTTPEEIITTLHDANGFGALDQLLLALMPEVLTTAQRHLAYPVLHNFLGRDRRSALAPNVAALDDAVTMLAVAVDGPQRPNASLTTMWGRSVDTLLEIVDQVGDASDQPVPPDPPLEVLDRLGIAHVDAATYHDAMRDRDDRRRRLHRYVESTRWDWPGA